jgi:hypothetical protein
MPRKPEYIRLEARGRYRKYRCRCSHCEHRSTFRRNPNQMRRSPECARCRRRRWRVDWNRQLRRDRTRSTCFCSGQWWFPHRAGSCYQHKAARAA